MNKLQKITVDSQVEVTVKKQPTIIGFEEALIKGDICAPQKETSAKIMLCILKQGLKNIRFTEKSFCELTSDDVNALVGILEDENTVEIPYGFLSRYYYRNFIYQLHTWVLYLKFLSGKSFKKRSKKRRSKTKEKPLIESKINKPKVKVKIIPPADLIVSYIKSRKRDASMVTALTEASEISRIITRSGFSPLSFGPDNLPQTVDRILQTVKSRSSEVSKNRQSDMIRACLYFIDYCREGAGKPKLRFDQKERLKWKYGLSNRQHS